MAEIKINEQLYHITRVGKFLPQSSLIENLARKADDKIMKYQIVT